MKHFHLWYSVCCLIIQFAKLMQPHQIKGIAQLAASGISCMMREGEFVIVNQDSGAAVSRNIVIPAGHQAWFVDIGDKCLYGILDCVCSAKCSDDAGLLKRIGLLGHGMPDNGGLPGRYRPR